MVRMLPCRVNILPRHWLNFMQHDNCMIVQICEVKRVACYARAETFTEAVASVASMVATYALRLRSSLLNRSRLLTKTFNLEQKLTVLSHSK